MLNNIVSRWVLGGWLAVVAVIVASRMAMGSSLSTSAYLLAIGMAPPLVFLLIRAGAPSPTVAEILHSATAKDGRS